MTKEGNSTHLLKQLVELLEGQKFCNDNKTAMKISKDVLKYFAISIHNTNIARVGGETKRLIHGQKTNL